MTEFAFRPTLIRVPAGTLLTLRFVNRGQIAHQFETAYLRATPVVVTDAALHVEAPGLDFVRLEPGASASLRFFARQRGRYSFACTIEGHREAGMVGRLEVR
jgi:uncharacterized cupredoxin-like copper-binding protein